MSEQKKPNHELSAMNCPHALEDVDLFSPGAQEHWYEAYDILHDQAPVHCIPGEGFEPGTDAFILSKHEDIANVVTWSDLSTVTSIFPVTRVSFVCVSSITVAMYCQDDPIILVIQIL